MMTPAALTSYSSSPLPVKIGELVDAGIETIDLYCFGPKDLEFFIGGQISPGNLWTHMFLDRFDPVKAAADLDKLIQSRWKRSSKLMNRPDICGLAVYLPDISHPDPGEGGHSEARSHTVKVLELLLKFMAALRKQESGYSCKVLELGTGQTLLRVEDPPGKRDETPKLRRLNPDACFSALRRTLEAVVKRREELFPSDPPIIALGVEPGSSKLIHDAQTMHTASQILRGLSNIGFILDIGHMKILKKDFSILRQRADSLKNPSLLNQITHIHISDNAGSAHFADLTIGTIHKEDFFQEWLRALLGHFRTTPGLFQGYVSVELEACGGIQAVKATYEKTKALIKSIS